MGSSDIQCAVHVDGNKYEWKDLYFIIRFRFRSEWMYLNYVRIGNVLHSVVFKPAFRGTDYSYHFAQYWKCRCRVGNCKLDLFAELCNTFRSTFTMGSSWYWIPGGLIARVVGVKWFCTAVHTAPYVATVYWITVLKLSVHSFNRVFFSKISTIIPHSQLCLLKALNWTSFMYQWFCSIHLIRLIRRKCLHF